MEVDREEIMKIIKEEWRNDHFLELGIYQHLVECKQKFEAVKNHAILEMSKEDLKFELDKELADLKVLLDLYIKEDMINKRLIKFKENRNNHGN